MEYDTKTPLDHTADPLSFASYSAQKRWPPLVTDAVNDVLWALQRVDQEAAKTTDEQKRELLKEKRDEGQELVKELSAFKTQIERNKELTPLNDATSSQEASPDLAGYNAELEQRGNPTWHNCAWLYAECYLYRKIATFFRTTKHWRNYDVFADKKISTFRSSRPAVLELAARYTDLVKQLQQSGSAVGGKSEEERDAAEKLLFVEMCEVCLWGNATDLSLLTNLTYEDIQKLQGNEARKANEKNILVNDFNLAFETLKKAQKSGAAERRVDIVLDNAGFELYVDLVLAGYLLLSGLATQIVLRPKDVPWFVSDVTPRDYAELLSALHDPKTFFETPSEEEKQEGKTPPPLSTQELSHLEALFDNWSSLQAEGKVVMRSHDFWTRGGSYWRLPATAPDLHENLKESELVIFKGDLNYRKLTGDAKWDPTTPFIEAIGPLGPGSGVRVLALRTCKADVVVGLKKGEDERLRALPDMGGDSGKRKWAWSGKWAVVSFSDGKA